MEVVKGGLLRRGFSRPPLDVQKKSFKDQNQVDLTQIPSMVLTLRVEQSKGELMVLGREVLGGGEEEKALTQLVHTLLLMSFTHSCFIIRILE